MSLKFLIVGDYHFSIKNPVNRVDDYFQASLDKLSQIIEISNSYDISSVYFTGDLFHVKGQNDNPVHFLNTLISYFSKFRHPCKSIIGNHDILWGKIDTLNCMPIYNLFLSKAVSQLVEDCFLLNDKRIHIVGFSYNTEQDVIVNYIPVNYVKGDVCIALCHQFVSGINSDSSMANLTSSREVILDIEALSKSVFSVFILGHSHSDFLKIIKFNDRQILFISPGSVMRIALDASDMMRNPKVGILSISDMFEVNFEFIPLRVKPPSEVFSSVKKIQDEIIDLADSFVKSLSLDFKKNIPIKDMIKDIPPDIAKFLIPYLEEQFLL